jgi:hypothetical protein
MNKKKGTPKRGTYLECDRIGSAESWKIFVYHGPPTNAIESHGTDTEAVHDLGLQAGPLSDEDAERLSDRVLELGRLRLLKAREEDRSDVPRAWWNDPLDQPD